MTSELEESNQEAYHQIITYMKGLRQEIATQKQQMGELKEHCEKCDREKSEDNQLTGKYCRDCGLPLTKKTILGDCPQCGCHYYVSNKPE